MLKPQDLVALVGLQVLIKAGAQAATLPQLAALIHLSASETHAALARLECSQLIEAMSSAQRRPNAKNFLEFAEHGLRYVFPAVYGSPSRGLPTAAAAVPGLVAPDPPLVWAWELGESYGPTLAPLYRTVPQACADEPLLHQALAALDCLRVGRARERQAGLVALRELFGL